MTKNDLSKIKLPSAPGVYFFLGAKKKILYIGKATSLKSRVASYFVNELKEKRSEIIVKMVEEAKTVDFVPTDSVLEALIVETNLIRTHKPVYNTRNKDDKSYNHLIITNEEFPRVLVIRGKDLTEKFSEEELLYTFGPFPSGQLFKEALKIIRKLFKFYDTKNRVGTEKTKLEKGRINFNRQIGLYPDKQTKEEYLTTIKHIRLFFEGKKAELVKELRETMMTLADKQQFEEADILKKRVFALEHIQDIALIKDDSRIYRDEKTLRIEAYDIAHLQGNSMVGVMTVVEGGQIVKSDYRKFKIKTLSDANDTAALKEVLKRRLNHPEWPFPQIIVMDGSTAQKNVAEAVLRQSKLLIPVVGVVKDDKHKPIRIIGEKSLIEKHKQAILLANAESHRFAIAYHRDQQRKKQF